MSFFIESFIILLTLRLVYFPEGQLPVHAPHWKHVSMSEFFIRGFMWVIVFKTLRGFIIPIDKIFNVEDNFVLQ